MHKIFAEPSKKSRDKFADPVISRTFAPAFGNEALMLDVMLQSCFARGSPVEFRFESRLSQERPKRTDPLRPAFEKLSKKTSQNIWRFENNSLPLHPLLRGEPRSWAPKKNFEKSSAKIWRICEKLLTFATAFRLKTGASRRAIFDEIYINNTVVQERNWKQFRVKQKNRQYLYI